MFFDKEQEFKEENSDQERRSLEIKKVFINAIKMQALYSDSRIKIVETSNLVN